MNSIHEPGSRTMSKNRLKNSTESNRAKNRLSAPSAQPTGPAARPGRAQACVPRAPLACCRARAPHALAPRLRATAPPRTHAACWRAPAHLCRLLPRAPAPRAPQRPARPSAPRAPAPRAPSAQPPTQMGSSPF